MVVKAPMNDFHQRSVLKFLPADLNAAAAPSATLALLERVRTALAHVAQFELANLKRMFKVDEMTETEIHQIIPDRPVAKKPPKTP
jgi:hypothetical protein